MSPELTVPAGMGTHRFRAMGTGIHVLAPRARLRELARVVEGVFAEWESTLSRFRPESELSRVNAGAGTTVPVGRLLLETVAVALDAARATGGLFDPLLHHQLIRIGYDRSFDQIGVTRPSSSPPPAGGVWRDIVVDRTSGTVTIPRGQGLDLGGIAKGMAVDESLRLLGCAAARPALVSAGGDLRVLGSPPSGRWDILVGDGAGAFVVPLVAGALATSGTAHRAWRQGGESRHHLLDPRTGLPARSGLARVTVAASTCRVAEVAATAAFVAGPRAGRRLLERYALAGLFVTETGTQIPVGRWPRHASALAA